MASAPELRTDRDSSAPQHYPAHVEKERTPYHNGHYMDNHQYGQDIDNAQNKPGQDSGQGESSPKKPGLSTLWIVVITAVVTAVIVGAAVGGGLGGSLKADQDNVGQW